MHRQPRPVHAEAQAGLDGSAADEGAGQRGEAPAPVGAQQAGPREATEGGGRTGEGGARAAADPLSGGGPSGQRAIGQLILDE